MNSGWLFYFQKTLFLFLSKNQLEKLKNIGEIIWFIEDKQNHKSGYGFSLRFLLMELLYQLKKFAF